MMKLSFPLLAALTWSSSPSYAETWTELANIPTGTLREHTTVSLSSSQIVTIGGVVAAGATTTMVQIYNIPNNTWSQAAPLPAPVNHGNAAVVDGKIFLLGGLTSTDTPYTWKATTTSAVYDPGTDAWTTLDGGLPASQARGAAALGVYNTTIFVAGGKAGTGARSVDAVAAFDTATRRWVSLPAAARALPAPRDHAGGAVVGHRFYVLGGRDTERADVKDTLFVLDLEDLGAGWATGAARLPTARGGLCAAALGTRIYTFGGEGNQAAGSRGVFGQTEVYDTETDSWASLKAMKTPRHGSSAAAAGEKIYIPGGGMASAGAGMSSGYGDTGILESFSP